MIVKTMDKKKFQVSADQEFFKELKIDAARRSETMNEYIIRSVKFRMEFQNVQLSSATCQKLPKT